MILLQSFESSGSSILHNFHYIQKTKDIINENNSYNLSERMCITKYWPVNIYYNSSTFVSCSSPFGWRSAFWKQKIWKNGYVSCHVS